ncbi:seminase-like [Eurosta solidaginis]|uniref:seminase-like n=1 Tax=Eurosta solidaginis TaxID=178769 RepID=UPI00353081A1
MNLRNYFAILLVALSCPVTYTNPQFRIVNGKPANIKDSPYLVSLHHKKQYFCAGALVTMKTVITAAHCLTRRETNLMIVVAGVTDIRKTGQRRKVDRAIIPPAYDAKTKSMDIGAIKVRKPFKRGATVNIISLCMSKPATGTQMRVSGWGTKNPNIVIPENTLQTTVVPIVEKSFCETRYKLAGVILTNTMICAGCGETDACIGDSGAPGIVNGQLCTVVSKGIGCADPNYPGIYTDVNNSDVRRFINYAIGI